MKGRSLTLLVLLTMLMKLTACESAETEYLHNFEIVWQTVHDSYFDQAFGGLDWNEVRDRYQPLIATVESDEEFYTLINDMLWELNVSHALVVPPGQWPRVLPNVFAEGSIGIDVRLLDGEAVIASVEPGSPGDQAGLRPGFVIQSIDSRTVKQITGEGPIPGIRHEQAPPHNERYRLTLRTWAILGRIHGHPETAVSIAYLDEHGETHQTSIVRTSREGEPIPLSDNSPIPPEFPEFESMRLRNDVGYIRFNAFHPALAEDTVGAIKSMGNAPGLIIDLRGNTGGVRIEQLEEHLISEQTLLLKVRTRDGTSDVVLDPADSAYEGPVVVLIDVSCFSACELFAACIQATGRAAIVGEHSAGGVTGANWMQLPIGAPLLYPVVQWSIPDGTVLEGHGVVPDIEVALDRGLLLQGIDSQLEAAIDYIEGEVQE